jgi:hypothetical protein
MVSLPNSLINPSCDEDFAGVKVTGTDERQKIDILYEVVTHTVMADVKVAKAPRTHDEYHGALLVSGDHA